MDDLIVEFIAETREGLEALDSELVRFEQHPDDPEVLGNIFRLIHTIKGTCGFIGLMRLQSVAHAAENVLGAFRDGELEVTQDAVTTILETVDLIRSLIDALSSTGSEPEGDDSALIGRLDALMLGPQEAAAPQEAVAPAPAPAAEAAPVAKADKRPLIERLGGDATLDTATEMMVEKLQAGPLAAVYGAADPFMLQFGLRDAFVGLARGNVSPEVFPTKIAELGPGGESPEALAQLCGHLSEALTALDVDPSATMALFASVLGEPVSEAAPAPAVQTPDPVVAAAPEPAPIAAPEPVAVDEPAPEPVQAPVAKAPAAPASAPPVMDPAAAQGQQTIRVSVDALEHLMTVASELVLIRNQLIQTLRLDPDSPFAGPLNRLNQVTTELQEGVMTTRMQPISGAWAKLPRLIRDLSNDLGKKIELEMIGQETELDRQVLELIKDPLTHMIRNAADHGLEDPATRLAAGKSEAGRIVLSARHEGGAIVIDISDDGRGLSVEKIRAKAVSSGLVTPARAEVMSDNEVRQFIFSAGLSTASAVTSVSGRGVGMDVVRTNIEKIGGVIELHSVEGQGTRFSIRIPLTLTIVSALIVECCGERFALPQSAVTELVSVGEAGGRSIEHINGAAVLRLRDRLLPLISLQNLLQLDASLASLEETCIVVVRLGAFSFGVVVDRIFDTEEIVVKPVSSVLRHLKVYSGATILGDGSVILILDPKGLSAQAGALQTHADETAHQQNAGLGDSTRSSMLVFRESNGVVKAAPLSAVSRIEEIEASALEQVNGRTVMQYRGRLMPVVSCNGEQPQTWDSGELRPLLVFNREDRPVGLLVQDVVDIVDSPVDADLEPTGLGAAGSLVINGAATELIDVEHYWRSGIDGGKAKTAVQPANAIANRKVLVIDPSPFSQMLLQPLLSGAGYQVTVVTDPEQALALHDRDERFDLIMADTSERTGMAHKLATTLVRADGWRATPLLGLDGTTSGALSARKLADAVSETFDEMKGAA